MQGFAPSLCLALTVSPCPALAPSAVECLKLGFEIEDER